MNFEALNDSNQDTPKPETPRTFDYVLLKEKYKRDQEQLRKIEEAQK